MILLKNKIKTIRIMKKTKAMMMKNIVTIDNLVYLINFLRIIFKPRQFY